MKEHCYRVCVIIDGIRLWVKGKWHCESPQDAVQCAQDAAGCCWEDIPEDAVWSAQPIP